MTIVVH
jgi:hypothetical protein